MKKKIKKSVMEKSDEMEAETADEPFSVWR